MARLGRPNFGSRRALIAWTGLIALPGVLLSAGIGWDMAATRQDMVSGAMDRRANLVAEAVTSETARYVDSLRAVASAAGAIDDLTAPQFARLAAPLTQMHLAGAQALVYIVPAADDEIAGTQRLWRSRGAAGLVLNAKPGVAEHFFSVLSQPLDGARPPTPGGDAARAASPTQALVEARRSGQVALSDAYQLLVDRDVPAEQRQMSLVLTAPVYGLADAHSAGAFRGWVLMGLRGRSFVGTTLTRVAQGMVDVTLRARDTAGDPTQIARFHAVDGRVRDLHREIDVPVAQRRWRLYVDAAGSSLQGPDHGPAVVVVGLLLTALVSALVLTLATGRGRAQAEVLRATTDLQAKKAVLRQQKADLTAFAGVVAHDLKGPLAGVAGYAEMINDQLAGDVIDRATMSTMLDRLGNGVHRMGRLIDDLLSYAIARDANLTRVDVDLRDIAADVAIAHLDIASAGSGPMPRIYLGDLPAVHADPAQVRQLLHNLIGNCLKYTAPGQTPRIDITALRADHGWVHVQIADRGIGIPAGAHDRIFDTFHRAHPGSQVAGTGLGLAICQRIVERHGGAITATDNPGGGTRITVILPAAHLPAAHPNRTAVPRAQLSPAALPHLTDRGR
jgi:signal transduction histidine kinase